MRSKRCTQLLVVVMALCAARSLYAQNPALRSAVPHIPRQSDLEFVENKGQLIDQFGKPMPEVLFISESKHIKCYLTEVGMHFVFSSRLHRKDSASNFKAAAGFPPRHTQTDSISNWRLDMEFVGANVHPRIEAENRSNGYTNYYLAHSKIERIPSFTKITYHDLYPHIDFVIYSKGSNMEYDFIVHPGGDPNAIALHYAGLDSIRCSAKGSLVIHTLLGLLEEEAPKAYQADRSETTIPSHFHLADATLSFVVGNYNKDIDLVIDPVQRMWGTYFGGISDDQIISMAVDRNQDIVVCGGTESSLGIATVGTHQSTFAGNQDAFIAKFSPTGQRLWTTYYGGESLDQACGIAIDSSGHVVISGFTTSNRGIASNGAFLTNYPGLDPLSASSEDFLAKFKSDGTLDWSTYFGGKLTTTEMLSRSVCCDKSGNIFFVGETYCTSGIATPGAQQSDKLSGSTYITSFVAKFSPTGSRLWVSYFGGEKDDFASTISADPFGNIILAGSTYSTQHISTPGAFQTNSGGLNDGFLAKFSSGGSLLWSTYYGGSGVDGLLGLSTDTAGNIYAAGSTESASGISTPGAFQKKLNGTGDGFIVKFSPSGVRIWGSYYGGEGMDYGYDLATDSKKILLCGTTGSVTGISTPDGYQPSYLGTSLGANVFFATFDLNGSRLSGTYYGRSQPARVVTCGLDQLGYVLISGSTSNDSGYTSTGAFSETENGGYDGFIASFAIMTPPELTSTKNVYCTNITDTVRVNPGYYHIHWFVDSNPVATSTDHDECALPNTITTGRHIVSVEVMNPLGWTMYDSLALVVSSGPLLKMTADTTVCERTSLIIGGTATGGIQPYSYTWFPDPTLSSTTIAHPIATPSKTTVYKLVVSDSAGCQTIDSVIVRVDPVSKTAIRGVASVCPPTSSRYFVAKNPGDSFAWTLDGGGTILSSPSADSLDILWTADGTWHLSVHQTNSQGCSSDTTITVRVSPTLTPTVSPAGKMSVCSGDTIILHADKGYGTYLWSNGDASDSTIITKSGSYSVSVRNANGCTGNSDTVEVNVAPAPSVTISADAALRICSGSSIHLSASGDPGTYVWSTGETTSVITVSQPGIYSVKVTTPSGCVGYSMPVTVSRDSLTHLPITGPTSICVGQGAVTYSIPNEVGATYSWSITGGIIANGQSTSSVSVQWNDGVAGAGVLSVIESTSGGCSDTGTVSVSINANLQPVIVADGPLSFCQGDSITLDAGSGYATYQWSKDGVTISGSTSELLRVDRSGAYSVEVSNSAGCSGISKSVGVTVFPLPSQPNITQIADTLYCTDATTYQWYLGGSMLQGQTGKSIVVLQPGSYSVTITDGNGCSATSAPIISGAKANAVIKIGDIAAVDPGTTFEIPIELVGSQNLTTANANHYVGLLRYDGSMLVPIGSKNGTLGGSSAISGSKDRTIIFEGSSTPMTSGTLQSIECKAMLGSDSCTTITIDTFYWTDASVAVSKENGFFCESGLCFAGGQIRLINPNGSFGIMPIRPNPASNRINIDYDLLETGRTRVVLSDIIGRVTMVIRDEDQKPGHYSISLGLDGIPSGCYQIGLKTSSQYTTQRMIIQK